MQRTDIDGVPVFTAPGPERITAVLLFGVGLRDETFATAGVTHLIEHLVMGALPKSHLQCNATVDMDTTAFYATGRPQSVRDFLETICRSLADLPTDRMELEIGILQAENCAGSHPTVAALLGARYGLRGPGLTVTTGPGLEYLTPEAVRAHGRRWFVRENAALWCHGTLPEGLELPLPSGTRPLREVPEPREQPGPLWTEGPVVDGAGLLLSGPPRDAGLGIGINVLRERMSDVARHARGLSYSAGIEFVNVAPDRRETALFVDAREGRAGEVGQILWTQLSELCENGPTPEELAHVVLGFEEELDGDEVGYVCGDLGGAAFGEVNEVPFLPARAALQAWTNCSPEQVRAALQLALPTAILIVPEGVPLDLGDHGPERRPFCGVVPEEPTGQHFRPSARKRAFSKSARVRLVVSDSGLYYVDGDHDIHFTRWGAIEAVIPREDGRGFTVISTGMCCFFIDAEAFGRAACEAVRSRIPEGVWLEPATAPSPPVAVPVG